MSKKNKKIKGIIILQGCGGVQFIDNQNPDNLIYYDPYYSKEKDEILKEIEDIRKILKKQYSNIYGGGANFYFRDYSKSDLLDKEKLREEIRDGVEFGKEAYEKYKKNGVPLSDFGRIVINLFSSILTDLPQFVFYITQYHGFLKARDENEKK